MAPNFFMTPQVSTRVKYCAYPARIALPSRNAFDFQFTMHLDSLFLVFAYRCLFYGSCLPVSFCAHLERYVSYHVVYYQSLLDSTVSQTKQRALKTDAQPAESIAQKRNNKFQNHKTKTRALRLLSCVPAAGTVFHRFLCEFRRMIMILYQPVCLIGTKQCLIIEEKIAKTSIRQ